ncbi:AAA-domain-containing protein [Testicularia cyperi]|uniref:AAA-domain-containing protein n=1 Tax=Testicularia cyperi TaxID=1882483 RepID=A0A317XM35_9BASI|nr:AAA-domain-containing protein [Testicularia cyperi]
MSETTARPSGTARLDAVIADANTAGSSSSRSRVLLPIESIRSLKLRTGDAVAICSAGQDEAVVGTIWPSFALSSGTVRLPALLQQNSAFQPGGIVSIVPLISHVDTSAPIKRIPVATSVQLIIDEADTATRETYNSLSTTDQHMLAIYAKQNLVDLECLHLGQTLSLTFQGILLSFAVLRFSDKNGSPGCVVSLSQSQTLQVCLVDRETDVSTSLRSIAKPDSAPTPSSVERVTDPYAKLGGLDRQIQEIKAMVEMPLMQPDIFRRYGLRPPKGVLLYGPPGTGKTSLARAVAAATGSSYLTINGPELSSAFHGETESKLRHVFRQAKRKSPCIVIIDEIDALAPRREGSTGEGANADGAGEVERRVVAQLLTLLDGIDDQDPSEAEDHDNDSNDVTDTKGTGGADGSRQDASKSPPRVVVLAATNRPNAIDPALRRPGRIDREIEIGIPSADARGDIIRTLIVDVPNSLTDAEINSLAANTHGYVGADLSALVREAGMKAVRRHFDRQDSLEGKVDRMSIDNNCDAPVDRVNAEDFAAALATVRPSAMREIFLEPPKVYWSDIAGSATPSIGGGGALSAKSVQSQIRELVEWPIKHADAFKRLGVSPPRGVLLYGPPGCSKTLIARALATESGLNFLAVKGPELYSKYVGESERAIREMFKKARAAAPSIIFFDEIDALSTSREGDGDALNSRIIASLLNEMDGIESMQDVIIVGATNRPQSLDPALLRPGRLDRLVYVGPPDAEARKEILRKRMAKMATDLLLIDLDKLATMTHGCSGAEVVSICQEAGLLAMDEDLNCDKVEQRHFEAAASSVKRRITSLMIQQYETWRDTLIV